MDDLTPQQHEQLKHMLDQREHALHADIERELHTQQTEIDVVDSGTEPEQSPFANAENDLSNAAVERERLELRAIALARKRMEAGCYGECMECGYHIPFDRLKAQPMAPRCVACQGQHEKSRT